MTKLRETPKTHDTTSLWKHLEGTRVMTGSNGNNSWDETMDNPHPSS